MLPTRKTKLFLTSSLNTIPASFCAMPKAADSRLQGRRKRRLACHPKLLTLNFIVTVMLLFLPANIPYDKFQVPGLIRKQLDGYIPARCFAENAASVVIEDSAPAAFFIGNLADICLVAP